MRRENVESSPWCHQSCAWAAHLLGPWPWHESAVLLPRGCLVVVLIFFHCAEAQTNVSVTWQPQQPLYVTGWTLMHVYGFFFFFHGAGALALIYTYFQYYPFRYWFFFLCYYTVVVYHINQDPQCFHHCVTSHSLHSFHCLLFLLSWLSRGWIHGAVCPLGRVKEYWLIFLNFQFFMQPTYRGHTGK